MDPNGYHGRQEFPAPPPFVPRGRDSDTSSTSSTSRARLGKRAINHPPAVSERSSTMSYGHGELSEKEQAVPKGVVLASITLALCCAVFMVTLVGHSSPLIQTYRHLTDSKDQTIVATAAPQITNEFRSLADVGWYGGA